MATGKPKPRRKARQSSIYRKLEHLLCDLMAISERIPKHALGLQAVGVRAINETLEALSVTEFAIRAQDLNTRYACISTLIHSMTIVKTICRELYDYSRKDRTEVRLGRDGVPLTDGQGKTDVVKSPVYGRVISHAQYVGLLGSFAELGKEVGRWQNATLLKMSQVNVSAR